MTFYEQKRAFCEVQYVVLQMNIKLPDYEHLNSLTTGKMKTGSYFSFFIIGDLGVLR